MRIIHFLSAFVYSANSIKLDSEKVHHQSPQEVDLLDVENQFFISFSEVEDHDNKEQYPNMLRWDHTPASIAELFGKIKTQGTAAIEQVVNVKGKRTFENTMTVLSKFEANTQHQSAPISFYSQVSTEKEIRDAAKAFSKKMGEMQTDLWMREDLYQAIKQYSDEAKKDGSYAKLDSEAQRYVNKTLSGLEDTGTKLNAESRKKFKQLKKEIAELEQKCQTNINDDDSKLEFHLSELKGIPEDQMKKLDKVPGKPDFRYIKLGKAQYGPAMKILELEASRKKLDFAKNNVAAKENVPMIDQLVQKRQELALLFNYTSYSQMTLENRMAKNVETVEKFEDELTDRIHSQGIDEMDKLLQFKRKITNEPDAKLFNWDISYYSGLFKKESHGVDEDKIREYFPSENVKLATMEIYQQLLGLEFVKLPNVATWHKDVSAYQVKDSKSKELLGHFYLDLYPRPNKYNHAAAFPLIRRAVIDGKVTPAAAAMVTNFSPPNAQEGKPSLLPHSDVVTFFHEFGHVMHNMCGEANYTTFAGTAVEKDFVEMPSQMLENWIWNKDILKKVSKHYKTGEPMPDALIDQKISTKNDNIATKTLNQIFLGTIDLLLYSANDQSLLNQYQKSSMVKSSKQLSQNSTGLNISQLRTQIKHKDGFKVDTEDLWHQLNGKIEAIHIQDGTNPIGTFGHLIAGYTSQYYSYLWSQVYSCDLFSEFMQQGIMNKSMGMKYRKVILAPGGSRDSLASLKMFLGREPDNKAFLKMNNFERTKLEKNVKK